ncbi:MAG TPA: hypothetical protein VGS06_36190 [Streptosporangiaceae bacterium]|nr:hypothetical protein [Streptosporangiaceae bacterium]
MNQSLLLADLGNIAVTVSAVLVTASVIAYAVRNRGGKHGRWWRSPAGRHLMSYMAALAFILDQGVIYMLATTGLLLHRVPPFRPDWFAWERVLSYLVLITFVFAWRLVLIIRPPQPPGPPGKDKNEADAA